MFSIINNIWKEYNMLINITCKVCNKKYEGYHNSRTCSKECAKIQNKDKLIETQVKKSLLKFPDGSDIDTYVECKVCGYRTSDLAQHPVIHGITNTEYRAKYGNNIKCKQLKDKMVGENNPGYNHQGKLSPFSKNFVNYKDDKTINELIERSNVTRSKNNNWNVRLDYYTSRGYSTEEATQLRSERQSTFSLDKCIQKYGEVEGNLKWNQRQAKWLKNFPKMNYSKISQELFNSIMVSYIGDVYYATYQRDNIESTKYNKEYKLSLFDGSTCMPDFICLKTKKVIEFDGDYWHSEKVANKTRESIRQNKIINSGYKVLRIKEFDYNKNKQKTIDRCLEFLGGIIE